MFKLLRKSYSKIRSALGGGLARLLGGKIDEETLEELEALFFQADLGVETSLELVEEVRRLMRKDSSAGAPELIEAIQQKLLSLLQIDDPAPPQTSPFVTLIVGVNGNGKTTSVAKLAHLYKEEGQNVLLGAADTFRAAAIDQLMLWSVRTGVQIVKHQPGSDPSAVVFDTLTAAQARGVDRVLIDTAGRLHTKTDLMEELAKMRRVCDKVIPSSPHETLLVLDATTGQNALEQAKIFHQFTPITGVILTKLDGTAKGGIVVPIQRQLGVPVKFIGLGEGVDDLQPFDSEPFVNALFAE